MYLICQDRSSRRDFHMLDLRLCEPLTANHKCLKSFFQYSIIQCQTKPDSAVSMPETAQPGMYDFVQFSGQVSEKLNQFW